MPVDKVSSNDPFVIDLATPADVDSGGAVHLRPENFGGGSGGVGAFSSLAVTNDATIGGNLGLTGELSVAGLANFADLNASGTFTASALSVGSISVSPGGMTTRSLNAGSGNQFTVSTAGVISADLQEFADNIAAVLGGLVAKNLYRTGEFVKVVV